MTPLDDLVERLTRATGPDRELDAAIALTAGAYRIANTGKSIWDMSAGPKGQFVLGRARPDEAEPYTLDEAARLLSSTLGLPHYTSSMDAAMMLVPSGWNLLLMTGDSAVAVELVTRYLEKVTAKGPSIAIALCIAALKARSHP